MKTQDEELWFTQPIHISNTSAGPVQKKSAHPGTRLNVSVKKLQAVKRGWMEAKRGAHIWSLFQCKSIPDNAVAIWSPDDLGVVTWCDTPANNWTCRPGLCPTISGQFVPTNTKQFDRYATTKECGTPIKLSVTLMCHLACFVETGDQTHV